MDTDHCSTLDTISVTEMLEREIQYGRLEVDNVNDAKVRPKECIR